MSPCPHPVVANEFFPDMPERVVEGLKRDGFCVYDYGCSKIRLVCAFNTRTTDLGSFIAAAERYAHSGDTE